MTGLDQGINLTDVVQVSELGVVFYELSGLRQEGRILFHQVDLPEERQEEVLGYPPDTGAAVQSTVTPRGLLPLKS